jgi:hypothetical protein
VWKNWKIVKPKPINAKDVRTPAIKVRSLAMAVRSNASAVRWAANSVLMSPPINSSGAPGFCAKTSHLSPEEAKG